MISDKANYPVFLRILKFFSSSFSKTIHHLWLVRSPNITGLSEFRKLPKKMDIKAIQPTPPKTYPPRNKGFLAGLSKDLQRFS